MARDGPMCVVCVALAHDYVCSKDISSVRSASWSRASTDRRGLRTMSCPSGNREYSRRRISRTRRRIRFRSCAFPSFLEVVRPNRVRLPSLGSTKATNDLDAFLMPLLYTVWNSPGFRSRYALGNRAPVRVAGLGSVVFNGQPLSSLLASPLDDCTSRRCLHPVAESVLLGSLPVVRLKGP